MLFCGGDVGSADLILSVNKVGYHGWRIVAQQSGELQWVSPGGETFTSVAGTVTDSIGAARRYIDNPHSVVEIDRAGFGNYLRLTDPQGNTLLQRQYHTAAVWETVLAVWMNNHHSPPLRGNNRILSYVDFTRFV
jgi:hypothetical protein